MSPVQERVSKIYSNADLNQVVEAWREKGLKLGFTCGTFDLLHAGHVDYLEGARGLCDRLIVAVNSDDSVRSYKNPLRPIVSEAHRSKVIAALQFVDAVTIMRETRPARLIELLKPDVYIKGGDYKVAELKSASLVESYGGHCVVLPVNHEISSSALVRRIEQLSQYALPEKPGLHTKGPLALLDRDGTLIDNVHFLNTPSRVRLKDGVGDGLRLLQDAGFSLAVVTNQQGIGLGYFDYDAFVAVNSEMLRQLVPYGVRISRFYFCPHSVGEQCACRKPGTQMIERALADFGCATENCFLIGDSDSDIRAAEAAGCKGILLASHSEPSAAGSAASFIEAVDQILSAQRVTK